MTVNKITGAAIDKQTAWMPIKADKAAKNVRRLQTRIVKAVQEKKMGQGESSATSFNLFAERQNACRKASHRQ